MIIRIETEKLTLKSNQVCRVLIWMIRNYSRSGKYRRVVSISGVLSKFELPTEYLKEEKSIYYTRLVNGTSCILQGNGDPLLSVDTVYPEETFQEVLAYIRKAGNNLHRINKNWKGIETFTI